MFRLGLGEGKILETITALILTVAAEFGLPPYFALAIAFEENRTLDPLAVNMNVDGTLDYGIMQLNSSWYTGDWQNPEANIRAGCLLIAELLAKPELETYWEIACAYNCGYTRYTSAWPLPESTLDYAARVMHRWADIDRNASVFIRK